MCKGIVGILCGHDYKALSTKLIKEQLIEKGTIETFIYIIICPRCGKGINIKVEKGIMAVLGSGK